jgi:hypothetical protein
LLITKIDMQETKDPNLTSFAFMCSSYILLAHVHNYSQPLATISFVNLNSFEDPKEGLTLVLPRFSTGTIVSGGLFVFSSSGDHSTSSYAATEIPFYAADSNRLVTMRFDAMSTAAEGTPNESYVIFLPMCRLLTLDPKRKISLEWEAWGPDNTRMLRLDRVLVSDSNQMGNGMRYVHEDIRWRDGRRTSTYELYDFDSSVSSAGAPQAATYHKAVPRMSYGTGPAAPTPPEEPLKQTHLTTNPTIVESLVFVNTIFTRLPYRKRIIHGLGQPAVQVTPDNLILIEVNEIILQPSR